CSPKTRCTSAMMDDPSDIAIMLCWHISNTTAHVKRLSKRHGKLILVPENQQHPPLAITETTAFEVWGFVNYVQPSSCLCSRYLYLQLSLLFSRSSSTDRFIITLT